jgi:serine/threonine-protein kinase
MVHFQIVGPWTQATRAQPFRPSAVETASRWLQIVVETLLLSIAGLLAWRNQRRARGDIAGSARLAVFAFVCGLVRWFADAHHVPALGERDKLLWGISSALFSAAFWWVLYMALEPYVRRRWPQSLITWTRLLAGGVRDPLVGGHILIGIASGIFFAVLTATADVALLSSGAISPIINGVSSLSGTGPAISRWVYQVTTAVPVALAMFFAFFLLRALLRKNWLATAVFLSLFVGSNVLTGGRPHIFIPVLAALGSIFLWSVLRFGVLSIVLGIAVSSMLQSVAVTADFSAWYAGRTYFTLGALLVLTAWSLKVALAGRPLWKGEFLDN